MAFVDLPPKKVCVACEVFGVGVLRVNEEGGGVKMCSFQLFTFRMTIN